MNHTLTQIDDAVFIQDHQYGSATYIQWRA